MRGSHLKCQDREDSESILFGNFHPRNADRPDPQTQLRLLDAREDCQRGEYRPWCRLLGQDQIPDDYPSRAITSSLVPIVAADLEQHGTEDAELITAAIDLLTGGQKCFAREGTDLLPLANSILEYELTHGAADEYLPRKLDALFEQTSLPRPHRQVLVAPARARVSDAGGYTRNGHIHHVRVDDPGLTVCGKQINYVDDGTVWREQPADVAVASCFKCLDHVAKSNPVRVRAETGRETNYWAKQMISRYVPKKIIDEAETGALRADNADERLRRLIWMQTAAFLDLQCMRDFDQAQRERAHPVLIGFGLTDHDQIPSEWLF